MGSAWLLIACCLLVASACAQECSRDALEPNDSFNQPTYIQSIVSTNLTICPANDKDFYLFALNNTEKQITFAVGCTNPALKLEGFLWSQVDTKDGKVLQGRLVIDAAKNICNYTEVFRSEPNGMSYWWFEIQSGNTSATGTYSLLIKEGTLCGASNSTEKTAPQLVQLPYDAPRSLCPQGGEEWFTVNLNQTMNVSIATDCGYALFPPRQLVGVWIDGETEVVVINASAGLCYSSMENVSPSRQYSLRFYRCTGELTVANFDSPVLSAGAYRLIVYETPYWTFPPLPLPSHRLLAAFVLLTVAFLVLCGIIALWYMQQRCAPREDLLLESSNGSSERNEEELQEVQPQEGK